MKNISGAMIAKIAFGVICIAAMFNKQEEIGTIVAGIAIGLGFIAWGLVPWLISVRDDKKAAAQVEKRNREYRERVQAQRKAEAERPRYCARCGASTKGNVCEYCGSPLDD